MKHILYILILISLQSKVFAGNADKVKATVKSIAGKVITANGEEVAGVKITIKETNETFFSDLDGNFNIKLKTDKTYSISVEGLGYAPLEVKSTDLTLFSELSLKELH